MRDIIFTRILVNLSDSLSRIETKLLAVLQTFNHQSTTIKTFYDKNSMKAPSNCLPIPVFLKLLFNVNIQSTYTESDIIIQMH